ncbi:MAG: preprotein translocase subunit YajC, partial [Verrucomicrobiota bacterium]
MTDTSSFPALLAQSSQQGFTLNTLLFFALLMVGMYFLMIAPQRKKEKEHKKMLAALKTGDKVITIGGIFGTITAIKEDRYHVKVDDS